MQIYEPAEDDPVAPPDDVPPTDEDGEPLPVMPDEDEIVVAGESDPILPLKGGKVKKVYVHGVRGRAPTSTLVWIARDLSIRARLARSGT